MTTLRFKEKRREPEKEKSGTASAGFTLNIKVYYKK